MSAAQRAIVTVCLGPHEGARVSAAPGELLTVGSGEAATLRIEGDPTLAPVHLEVRWDGRAAELRHLGGPRLTLLGGQAVESTALQSGDWIRAGATDLLFTLEAHTPASAPRDPGLRATAEWALPALRARASLHAVVDASRERRIHELLREAVEPARSLFDGLEGTRTAAAAPYLVALRGDSRLLDDLVREGWGLRWALWLVSEKPLAEVRRHLRRFLLARLEGGDEPVYFRYYDPEVFRVYFDTCTLVERAAWFGDVVLEFLAEDPSSLSGWWSAESPKRPRPAGPPAGGPRPI